MNEVRSYPDDPASPFEEPPLSFTDREGRDITIQGYEPGSPVPGPLIEMYDAFDPADRAQGIPPSSEAAIREWLSDLFADGFSVVAWHGERVAGHAILVPEGEPEAPDDGEYELAIFVLQAYQGAGIGKRLLQTLLGFGASYGVSRVWLTVERWNRPAMSLYETVGFEVTDARTFEHEMCLRLSK